MPNDRLFLLLLRGELFVMGEVAQCPHDYRGDKDDTTHLLQILLALLPRVAADSLRCRHAVRRQLHHERRVLALDDELREDATDDD